MMMMMAKETGKAAIRGIRSVINKRTIFLFLITFLSQAITAQRNKQDSLVGFDYKDAHKHALPCQSHEEKEHFMNWAERQYIKDKFYPTKMLKTKLVEPVYGKLQAPQPANCTNIDFESNNLNGWTVAGDYSIMSGGNDPFGNFPRVYPGGGNYSLRLNNNNIVNKTNFAALASRVITVGPQNNYLNLHFALAVLNYPHQSWQAAKFKVQFLDNLGNVVACPQFLCYYATPGGPVGINNFQQTPGSPGVNIGGVSYPVSYAPWQTVGLDLTPYMFQTITMEISCDWCIYNYDWAYCYIDADCFGSFDPLAAACGNLPFNLCGPSGMQSYTWTPPGGGIQTFSNCCMAGTPGIFTLQCVPYNTCGPAILTYTFNVQPRPTANFNYSVTPCQGNVSFTSTSLNNGGPPITTHQWQWMDGTPNGSGTSPTHSFVTAGTQTVQLVVTSTSGCKDSTTRTFTVTPPVTFTVNNITNSNSITCLTPTINLNAVTNYTFGSLNYLWVGPSYTANTNTASVTQPGVYTVSAIDPLTGCTAVTNFTIGQNTAVPVGSVNPLVQSITCGSGSAAATFTATAITPTQNVSIAWYTPQSPYPGGIPSSTCGGTICPYSALAPGTFTVLFTDPFNGCVSTKTVLVNSLMAYPTFSISSPTNFSVGCNPLHQTTISIINPVSTQTPAGACSYTFLPPSFVGVVSPSVALGGNTSTVTQLPGTWTIIVQDNSNFCRTVLFIPVIQNTVAPNVAASMLTQTLNCYNPTVIGTGTSSTPNTIINWGVPSTPPLLSTSTLIIGPPTGPNTSTTSLTYATYTVIATNTVNACQSTSIITINQNFKPPVSSPTISIGTPTAIYCTVSKNPVVLTTGNSTTTSGGVNPPAFVANPCWAGPSPMTPICGPSSYSCYVPGIYTLTVMDNYNGCTKSGTINVLDKTQPPVLSNDTINSILDCGATSAKLVADIIGSSSGLMYWYIAYPLGTAFSPTAAPISNSNPILCGTPSRTVMVSTSGLFDYLVTNTLTGCIARGSFSVSNGGLLADFTPDQVRGYAPLSVNFTNNSGSALGSTSITSVWSFGNGTSQTTTTNINTTSIYSSPGTYTVMLLTSKGECLDTAYKIIIVDMPSKMEVPNVFTPNGDGSNDVFFLKVANLTEVNAIIFDRWGTKVYEVNSSTGNIAWDGKNLQGKECASGVYFYVIKATGKDDQNYQAKGNVSLFR